MKIDSNVSSVQLPSLARQVSPSAGSTAVQGTSEDRVTLGSSAGNVQSLTAQAMNTPPVRQEKVAALQSAIREGSYKVDPGQIASAMISSEGV